MRHNLYRMMTHKVQSVALNHIAYLVINNRGRIKTELHRFERYFSFLSRHEIGFNLISTDPTDF